MSTGIIQPGHVGFHSGELAVQRRAGVEAQAARLSGMVAPGELRGGAAALLADAPFAAVTARDRRWAAVDIPRDGTARLPGGDVADATVDPKRPDRTTRYTDLDEGQPVGIIAMDFAAKRRVRINGTLAGADGGTLEVDVEQAYGNCPQYIRRRHLSPGDTLPQQISRSAVMRMVAADIDLIRSADTFFLGTTHPERGNDASHRGGPAGFVRADHQTVEWPDFPGNNMFNSMGNLAVDPTAALLFIDFRTGRTLQLSGRASRVGGPGGRRRHR